MHSALAACLILCLAVVAGKVVAQPQVADEGPALEELLRQGLDRPPSAVEVSTASRFAQSAVQAPSVVYVLTAQDIRELGLRNLADVLRSLPGLYVIDNSVFTFVAARGLGRPGDLNARLLFLLDGMRVNENIYDAAQIGREFFIDVDLIERVEFAPGPGSAVYGNNAFLGVVNIVTKRANRLAGLHLQASRASDSESTLALSYGHRADSGAEGWIAASAFEQARLQQPFELPPGVWARFAPFDWDRGRRLSAYAAYQGLSLRAGIVERERGLPVPLNRADPPEPGQRRSTTRSEFVALAWERNLDPDWDLTLGLQSQRALYQRDDPYRDEAAVLRTYRDRSLGRWQVLEARLSYQGLAGHFISMGLEHQRDTRQLLDAGTVGEPPLQSFDQRDRRLGLFVQDEWRLGDKHSLMLGLRRDHTGSAGASLSPRLAWVWNPAPTTGIKLLYGSAFRGANRAELANNTVLEAPLPAAERVRSLELALDHGLNRQWRLHASAYLAAIRGLIRLSPEFPVFENGAAMRSRGVELGLAGRFAGGGQLLASLEWHRNRSDAATDSLNNQPTRQLKLTLSQPLWSPDWRLSGQVLAASHRQVLTERLPGYALLNLNLLWQLDVRTELVLGLHNAADRRIQELPDAGDLDGVQQSGRVLRLSLSRRFGS